MPPPSYIVDANVFIEAYRRYYAFDLLPPFWECLIEHARTGRICSVDHVLDELERQQDDLAEWAHARFAKWFFPTDEADVTASYRQIMEWVNRQSTLLPVAKAEFASGADSWIVAYARVNAARVVTMEKPADDAKKCIKLPTLCRAFGVQFANTFDMLRQLGVCFS
jgi:hypothetical protein